MRALRRASAVVLLLVAACAAAPEILLRSSYRAQNRLAPNAEWSRQYPLGTDSLGRDRMARLVYGARISLALAPAGAFLAVVIAAAAGISGAFAGGRYDRLVLRSIDLATCMPWIFLLLIVRTLLPLSVAPQTSAFITFLLLGCLGWAAPARIIRTATTSLLESPHWLHARALGTTRGRMIMLHLLPGLRPVLLAQFWISIPAFVLAEANLTILGLGVLDPLPSIGGLLRELENYDLVLQQPWMLAPLLVLVLIVLCFQLAVPVEANA